MSPIRPLAFLVAAVLLVALAGCGGAATATPVAGHQSPGASVGEPLQIAGDGPVATTIMIDRTPLLGRDREVANGYVQAGLRFAAPTIARGGRLVVQAFGRLSGHRVTLWSATLPTLRKAGPAARDDAGMMLQLDWVLRIAVGLDAPPSTDVATALARLTRGAGSDIARAVAAAIANAAASSLPQRNVLIATDGWAFEAHRLSLARILDEQSPSEAVRRLTQATRAATPTAARVSLLRMVGLGYTSGRRDPTPTKLDELVAAWRGACANLPVTTCDIAPEL